MLIAAAYRCLTVPLWQGRALLAQLWCLLRSDLEWGTTSVEQLSQLIRAVVVVLFRVIGLVTAAGIE